MCNKYILSLDRSWPLSEVQEVRQHHHHRQLRTTRVHRNDIIEVVLTIIII